MMTRAFFLLTALALGAQASPPDSKIVAVAGPTHAVSEVTTRILAPAGLTTENYIGIPIPVADYPKYRAVIFAERDEPALNEPGAIWTTPEAVEQVRAYLRAGGIVIFCNYGISNVFPQRELGLGAELAGFASYPDAVDPRTISLTSDCAKWLRQARQPVPDTFDWIVGSCPIAKGVSSAVELAVVLTNSPESPQAFATKNEVGDGRVYFFAASLNRLVRERRGSDSIDGFGTLLRAALQSP